MPNSISVLAVAGLPGAGKTTLARALAPHLGARVVSRDIVRRAMFSPCSFTHSEKMTAFEAVLLAAAANCELGTSTVVEGMPFSRSEEITALRAVAGGAGAVFSVVLCETSADVAKKRIAAQRSAGESMAADRNPELVDEVAQRFDPLPPDTVRVSGEQALPTAVNAVLDALRPPGRHG